MNLRKHEINLNNNILAIAIQFHNNIDEKIKWIACFKKYNGYLRQFYIYENNILLTVEKYLIKYKLLLITM